MANIVVTSNTRGVIFNLGIYSNSLGFSRYFRDKSTVMTVALMPDRIEYKTIDLKVYNITWQYDSNNPTHLVVDSVNGTAPTSLDHLFDLLVTLLN